MMVVACPKHCTIVGKRIEWPWVECKILPRCPVRPVSLNWAFGVSESKGKTHAFPSNGKRGQWRSNQKTNLDVKGNQSRTEAVFGSPSNSKTHPCHFPWTSNRRAISFLGGGSHAREDPPISCPHVQAIESPVLEVAFPLQTLLKRFPAEGGVHPVPDSPHRLKQHHLAVGQNPWDPILG